MNNTNFNPTQNFLPSITNKKHLTFILLLLDGGLNTKEAITLKWNNCNLKKKLVHIKGKSPEKDRIVHLPKRLYRTLEDYEKSTPKKGEFILPGRRGPLTRRAVEKICKKISKDYPDSQNITPKTIQSIFIKEQPDKQNENNYPPITISREIELEQINDLIKKGCNVLLLGPIGIGKSHLIKHIMKNFSTLGKKILFIEDCSEIKRTLIECLIYLYNNDKKHVHNLLYGAYDTQQLQQNLQRNSVTKLTQEIIKITNEKEYLLVIDQVDTITPKAIKTIEALKDHFTILTSARQILTNKSSFTWNFQVIHIKKLDKESSIALIKTLSNDIPIQDEVTYINHIYQQSDGNPRIIIELIDRFQKEGNIITDQTVSQIKHIGNRKEYDLSIFIVVILAGLAALRYISSEIGEPRLRALGGISLLILVVYRYFFPKMRNRKNSIYYK
jgi:integrase/recombinase XerD